MTKAPDYAFRIGGVRKFFVEAKRPGVDIKNDPDPAYQLRRYAWSAKLPLSILTDFEEFAVYDCRIKPNQADKASVARVLYISYTEYEARWEEIAAIFSREAILKGSFDKYVESSKKKRGTAEVDDAFLKEIEIWRDLLARNIALRNPDLSTRELNYAVQRTIDRIIFLRICEDRGVESYGQLRALQNGAHVYPRLCQIFRRADERYNSGLFHFSVEKGRNDLPDDLTLNLTIDDKVLKGIFKGLYYPESPFEFSVLPADILGHIYEQFLGKVIRLTAGHHAKVEDKPEVKKAGGVYYTPTYIVDYIVKNTVGKLLEGKTPTKVAKIRVLDPACGSGSFLLGAYQHLLDWHQEWYTKHDPEKHAKGRSPKVYQGPGGEWRLTTAEKKRILLNNIYGVDIDTQAVEVTKLSLLLKVLEGENAETLGKTYRLFHERALPDLGENIKCGNSLIGPDFYEGQQLSLLDDEERYRINAFDWDSEFPEIMQAGGFDVVIGNPPYISYYSRESLKPMPTIETYLTHRFSDCVGGRKNTFLFFLCQSLCIRSQRGYTAMIVPDTLTNNDSYELTRRTLIKEGLQSAARLDFPVFNGPTVRTVIPIAGPDAGSSIFSVFSSRRSFLQSEQDLQIEMAAATLGARPLAKWPFASLAVEDILTKMEETSIPLGSVAKTRDGVNPGPKSFRTRIINPPGSPKPTWRPLLEGRHIMRFYTLPTSEIIDYDASLLTQALKQKGASFRDPRIFIAPKLVNRQTADSLIFALDDTGTKVVFRDTLQFIIVN